MNDHAPERRPATPPRDRGKRPTTQEQRQLEILDAVLRHGGNQTAAADEIGCTPANIGGHLHRLGLIVPRDRAATLDMIQRYVASRSFSRTIESRRPEATRPVAVTIAARCHPDRQEFAMGLCGPCYRERVARSREAQAVEAREAADDRAVGPSPTTGVGQSLTTTEFAVLEALIKTGGRRDPAADALGVSPHTVQRHVQNVCKKTQTTSLMDAYAALGWLRADYEETMVQEFRRMLEHFDAAIHRAIGESRRVAE